MRTLPAVLLALILAMSLAACSPETDTRAKDKPATSTARHDKLIDINQAKEEELIALKGIGEARARAIIKGRPYARKDELVQKKIVPQSVYEDIREQIVARQH